MSLANLCLALFLILASISQYFMKWVDFEITGLFVTGLIGFVAGILLLLAGLGVYDYTFKARQ